MLVAIESNVPNVYYVKTDNPSLVWVRKDASDFDEQLYMSYCVVRAISEQKAINEAVIKLLIGEVRLVTDPLWKHR